MKSYQIVIEFKKDSPDDPEVYAATPLLGTESHSPTLWDSILAWLTANQGGSGGNQDQNQEHNYNIIIEFKSDSPDDPPIYGTAPLLGAQSHSITLWDQILSWFEHSGNNNIDNDLWYQTFNTIRQNNDWSPAADDGGGSSGFSTNDLGVSNFSFFSSDFINTSSIQFIFEGHTFELPGTLIVPLINLLQLLPDGSGSDSLPGHCDFEASTTEDIINPEDGLLSLREAIIAANHNGNGEDTICLDAGTYLLNIQCQSREGESFLAPTNVKSFETHGDLDILENLIIHGEGKDNTFIDASFLSRIFEVFEGVTLTLKDLTLVNGNAGIPAEEKIFQSFSQGGECGGCGDNDGGVSGGGILNFGHLILQNVDIYGSAALLDGGAIASFGEGIVEIINGDIVGNSALDAGGAIFAKDSEVIIEESEFHQNSASFGGAIYAVNSSVDVVASTIDDNHAMSGGGILADNACAEVNVLASTLSNNSALAGGAVYINDGAHVDFINSTASGNVALQGSAFDVSNYGSLYLANSTIADNVTLGLFAGAVQGERGTSITLESSIVAGNSSDKDLSGQGTRSDAVFSSEGHNLIGSINYSDFSVTQQASDIAGSSKHPIDPLLGPLEDNGGPTLTHAPLPGSPAIDAGSNPEGLFGDQRGEDRGYLAGQTDIGAYESQSGESPPSQELFLPIALDLNGDGVGVVTLQSSVTFDANEDGLQDLMKGWIGPDDGFLVYDENGDHQVNSARELSFVGYDPNAKTDLDGLRLAFDTNHDSVLNSQDAGFDHFAVWKDVNQDGQSDPGEVLSLQDVGIASLSLTSHGPQDSTSGYAVLGVGEYTHTDGSKGIFQDVGLSYVPGTPAASIQEAVTQAANMEGHAG